MMDIRNRYLRRLTLIVVFPFVAAFTLAIEVIAAAALHARETTAIFRQVWQGL